MFLLNFNMREPLRKIFFNPFQANVPSLSLTPENIRKPNSGVIVGRHFSVNYDHRLQQRLAVLNQIK